MTASEEDRWATHPPVLADGFEVPQPPASPDFVVEPLGPEHNESDYRAWQSSVDHIRATPGFAGRSWPDPDLTLDDNHRDLVRHRRDYDRRVGFTYTVLDPADREVIGCVYVYPYGEEGAMWARCWVTSSRADLDGALHRYMAGWLAADWPFRSVVFPGRDSSPA